MVVAVNKMDLIDWDKERFEAIRDEFHASPPGWTIQDVPTIPICALQGDNVVNNRTRPWYEGRRCSPTSKTVYIAGDRNLVDVRFPVQYVIRPQTHEHHDHRSYAGHHGQRSIGPATRSSCCRRKDQPRSPRSGGTDGPVEEAFPPMAVSISLADDIDISRGDIALPYEQPANGHEEFDATVCWMADERPGPAATTSSSRPPAPPGPGFRLDYRLDVNTLHRDKAQRR